MARGTGIIDEPYTIYDGQRLADFNADQQAAFSGARDLQSTYQPNLDLSQAVLGMGVGETAGMGGYFSPESFGSTYTAGSYTPSYQAGMFDAGYNPTQFQSNFTPTSFGTNYSGRDFTANYNPTDFTIGDYAASVYNPNYTPQTYTADQADPFFNQHTERVLDVMRDRAEQRFDEDQLARDAQAVQAGAFGGDRQAVYDSMTRRDFDDRMDQIEAQALESAFDKAHQLGMGAAEFGERSLATYDDIGLRAAAFGNDTAARAAELGLTAQQYTDMANRYGGDLGVRLQELSDASSQFAATQGLTAQQLADASRQFGATQDMTAQQLYDAALAQAGQFNLESQGMYDSAQRYMDESGLNAAIFGDQANQFASSQDLQAWLESQNLSLAGGELAAGVDADQARIYGEYADQYGTLAGQNLSGESAYLDMLRQMGAQQQELDQRSLDIASQDFVNQRDYDRYNLQYLSSLLQGFPISANTDVQTYESYNPYSEMLGLGLGSLGLYNTFSG